ncbi:MAG: exo-alpha-sialidase [Eubacterium sp.]|nr:exo-alpha-sialidase [Eubacterium sp.]MBP3918138.1 exo-alpha-sialidase [Clostridia bacterium]
MGTKDEALLPSRIVYAPMTHNEGHRYADCERRFQGIPGVERTAGGRLYYCFYSGQDDEGSGNFVMLYKSDDHAKTPFTPVMVIEPPTPMCRTFDPCLWVDPRGRLWIFWAQSYTHYDGRLGVWASVCDMPDASDDCAIRFSAPRRIANGIMMNKPTVLQNGNWLLPCAIWQFMSSEYNHLENERFPNVYCSCDEGETFSLIGHASYENRLIDEHMLVQRKDGSLWMLIRAKNGIGQSFSDDGGYTWYGDSDTGLGGPCSRFCIRRLHSGNLLLVNHHEFNGRNHLKAMLSRDDGRTWEGYLMIDERTDVSYPDVTEDETGHIYIAYDYKRYTEKELLLACVTETDILAGKIVDESSRLRILVNRAYGEKT